MMGIGNWVSVGAGFHKNKTIKTYLQLAVRGRIASSILVVGV
jgi:hypothetical protein